MMINPGVTDIQNKRRKLLEGLDANEGFEQGLRESAIDQYAGKCHFIYELLQNAGDSSSDTMERGSFLLKMSTQSQTTIIQRRRARMMRRLGSSAWVSNRSSFIPPHRKFIQASIILGLTACFIPRLAMSGWTRR